MEPFSPAGPDAQCRLLAPELELLLDLTVGVLGLFGGPSRARQPGLRELLEPPAEAVARPIDPALLALLPDASADATQANEFRRFTQVELHEEKARRLAHLRDRLQLARVLGGPSEPDLEALHDVRIPSEAFAETAAALTDLRTVVASRLDITDDAAAEDAYDMVTNEAPLDIGNPRNALLVAFVMLGVLQESLVELLLDRFDDDAGGHDAVIER